MVSRTYQNLWQLEVASRVRFGTSLGCDYVENGLYHLQLVGLVQLPLKMQSKIHSRINCEKQIENTVKRLRTLSQHRFQNLSNINAVTCIENDGEDYHKLCFPKCKHMQI